MAQLLIKKAPPRETRNTYNLPTGQAIQREQVKVFKEQRAAAMGWLDNDFQVKRDPDIPDVFPDWDSFQLGALSISERMTPLLAAIWDTAGEAFTARIGLDPDSWSVTNPYTQEAIDKAALDFCTETNKTTSLQLDDALKQVKQALTDGLITSGQSMDQLTKAIGEIFDGAETWRARRIATTEASRAVHDAQELAAKNSGVVKGWKWLLSSDACPMCQTIARRTPFVRMDQPFAIIGDNPTYSTIKHPPAHPGCQCALVEILDIDDEPDWGGTLIQPKPEEEDYPPGEAPESAGKPAKQPKPAPQPKPRPKPKPEPKPEPEPPAIQPGPTIQPDPVPAMTIEQFAKGALSAAKSVPVAERYGDTRVWISDAYREFMAANPGATVTKFKQRLVEANQERLLTLAEMDLPHKLPPELRAKRDASETTQGRAVNHFIRLPG